MSKIATFLTIPLYAIFTILSYIVFVVVFSPAGVKSFTGFEQLQLTADVLQNFFFYLSILSVVVLGLIRRLWVVKVPQESELHSSLFVIVHDINTRFKLLKDNMDIR